MSKKPPTSIKDIEFIFENTPVKIIANKDCPEIDFAGLNIEPFVEGKEYEVKFWVGRAGKVRNSTI